MIVGLSGKVYTYMPKKWIGIIGGGLFLTRSMSKSQVQTTERRSTGMESRQDSQLKMQPESISTFNKTQELEMHKDAFDSAGR